MSGVLNSSFLNGSATNITHGGGRSFSSSFSAQPRAGPPVFHHTGIKGLHNMRTDFNVPSMVGSLSSRNSAINGVPSGGMKQSSGNLLAGLFGSNNIQDQLSQISHAVSDGHSGITNRGGMNIVGSPGYSNSSNIVGGSIHGVLPTSAAAGNRGAIPGLDVSPMMGNAGSRITSSVGNIVGSRNIGRNMSSGGGLSVPGLSPRLNFMSNNGSGNSGLQGPNGLMGGVLQQASPQVLSMLGNSYVSGGNLLSQNHGQAVNCMSSRAMLHDMNSNDTPFSMDDFPSLVSRPNSVGAPQGQIGSRRKQGLGGPIGCIPSNYGGVELHRELYKELEACSGNVRKIYISVWDPTDILYLAERFADNDDDYVLYSSEINVKLLENAGINSYVPREMEDFEKVVTFSVEQASLFFPVSGFEKFEFFVMNGLASPGEVALCSGALLNNKVVVVDPKDYKMFANLVLIHGGLSPYDLQYLKKKARMWVNYAYRRLNGH